MLITYILTSYILTFIGIVYAAVQSNEVSTSECILSVVGFLAAPVTVWWVAYCFVRGRG